MSKLRVLEVAIGIAAVQHGAVPGRFSKIRERRTPRIRARAEEAGMTIKRRDPEFLHPDTVAQLRGLTDEEAAKHSPIIRERDGVFMQQRRIGRRVRCREVEASGVLALETCALHAAAEAEFGRSLPLFTAGFPGGGVPDLDAIETSIRDGVPGGGAKRYAALLETVDARLAGKSRPSCPSCGRRMERRGRVGKTFGTRLGEVRVKRRYFYCRKCGVGDYPLDRALRLAGKRVTPGAEAIYADAVGSDSCGEANRKLWNLAGAAVSRATLQRHSVRIGEEMQAFEREDAEAASPAAERVLPGIDGTGVSMAVREVEGVACKQIVGSRFKGAGRRWSKIGANAVLAIKCCFRNNRWPDFLDWRDCSAAAA